MSRLTQSDLNQARGEFIKSCDPVLNMYRTIIDQQFPKCRDALLASYRATGDAHLARTECSVFTGKRMSELEQKCKDVAERALGVEVSTVSGDSDGGTFCAHIDIKKAALPDGHT